MLWNVFTVLIFLFFTSSALQRNSPSNILQLKPVKLSKTMPSHTHLHVHTMGLSFKKH